MPADEVLQKGIYGTSFGVVMLLNNIFCSEVGRINIGLQYDLSSYDINSYMKLTPAFSLSCMEIIK